MPEKDRGRRRFGAGAAVMGVSIREENFSTRSPHFLSGFGAKSDRHKTEGRCMR